MASTNLKEADFQVGNQGLWSFSSFIDDLVSMLGLPKLPLARRCLDAGIASHLAQFD